MVVPVSFPTIIVQARMSSTRLPGKALLPLHSKPLLQHLLERLQHVRRIARVIVATTTSPEDDAIEQLCKKLAICCFRGPKDDVLLRYRLAAESVNAQTIVRVTGDCPLIAPEIVDEAIAAFMKKDLDWLGAGVKGGFPRGVDVEVFSYKSLVRAEEEAMALAAREHVTWHFYQHPERYRIEYLEASSAYRAPHLRLCVDELDDYRLVKEIYKRLYKGNVIPLQEVLLLLQSEPSLAAMNSGVQQVTC